MKLNEMIMVVENWKGIQEKNYLVSLMDAEKLVNETGKYSPWEFTTIFSKLGRSLSEPDWAEIYAAGNKTFYMSYCQDEKQLMAFLNKKYNDEDIEDVSFDFEKCSESCKEKLKHFGIGPEGKKNKLIDYHYSRKEHCFRKGETLHNFNGKDYKVCEVLSPKNLLLMDMDNANFVVGLDTNLYFRQIKGDTEEPQVGIEWGHGIYLDGVLSRTDLKSLREDYGTIKEDKTKEDVRLDLEEYYGELYHLANNPLCNEEVRTLLNEMMRAEFCTDKKEKFMQNLSAGIYDRESEMKVFPVRVNKELSAVINVRGIDMEDAIEAATNVVSMAVVNKNEQKIR